MLDLATHGEENKNKPVNNQYGPEDGQVEDLTPRAAESNDNSASGGMPELELGKAAHEWLELIGRLCGQISTAAFFHVFSGLETGVEFG